MTKAPTPFAWRTFMFAVPGQETGPLALGTGTSRDLAIVDAHERMLQRGVVSAPGVLQDVAQQLQAALGRFAQQVTTQKEAFEKWFGESKVATADGEPMVVFHGTTAKFLEFSTPARRSFGAHFGTPAQALEVGGGPGARMLPVYLAIQNPVRLKDAGTWGAYEMALQLRQQALISPELFGRVRAWVESAEDEAVEEGEFDPYEAMRSALEDKGVDGIVYLNRSEATGHQDRDWPTSMSDEDFLQYIPHAQDSWIAFRADQIRRALPQRRIPAEGLSAAIAQVSRTQQFWKLMLEESRAEAGPFDGGCLIVAQALIQAAGRGELVRVASELNPAEHYGARIDGVVYDFNGAAASEQEWVERFVSTEQATDWGRIWHFAEGLVPCADIIADPKTSVAVAEMLRKAYPLLQPQIAWSHAAELDMGGALAVVYEAAGRYPGVNQMGHDYVNDETHLMAVSLASDATLARRMTAIDYDPAKAKLVLGPAARDIAAEAEIDLNLVDWSEVTAEFTPEKYEETSAATAAVATPACTLIESAQGRRIEEDVLEVLRSCTVEGLLVRLPAQRLDPRFYARVNEVLSGLGGRWTGGKVQGHVFEVDPSAVLQVAIATGSYMTPQDFGYFPTPAPLVQQLLQLAGLELGMRVLEPQAGRGAIALAAAQVVGRHNVSCVELLPDNAAHLRQAGFSDVAEQDFLALEPDEVPQYDRVLMNPPFSRLADVAHVMHATRFLKPDGRLVGITAPSWERNASRKAAAFRDFVEECEGACIEIPAGAFRESGTDVATRIVVLEAEKFPWHRRELARERQRA